MFAAVLPETVDNEMLDDKSITPAEATGAPSIDRYAIEEEDDTLSEQRTPRMYSGPRYLLPDSTLQADGTGPAVDLGQLQGKLLVVTLGIDSVVERTGLTVSVWGSEDGSDWGEKPLVTLRQRQYCGVYSALVNLGHRPEIRSLRVQWSMSRWGKGERTAQFNFRVFLEESGARISSSACA
jgi:hypothetical protein